LIAFSILNGLFIGRLAIFQLTMQDFNHML
jgi:hypothetical protein